MWHNTKRSATKQWYGWVVREKTYKGVYYALFKTFWNLENFNENSVLNLATVDAPVDLYLEHSGIKSSILIDTRRGEISLPEAGVILNKLHRREKALYTLLILESASGGINFTKPNTEKKLEKYRKRILSIQQKYNIIYKKFGGEETNAPDIEKDKIRFPMISLIKKELTKYQEQLFNIDDYIIQRNIYGNYCINLDHTKCLCRERVSFPE